ncbi:protocadherin gamma-A4-like isoform X3, partial [Scomber scombrus]
LTGNLDYEKAQHYEIHVQASDDGGLTDSCKIIVEVTDTNDNPPSINIMSKTNSISENSAPGTVVTIFNVQDPDSGENGKVACNIAENMPFVMKATSKKFFSLITDIDLDRERSSEYNITVTCSDEGVPSLSSSVTLTLQISDVNDNAPVFDRSSYEAYIKENNTPGLSIFTVKARDDDWNQNARVSYILEDSSFNGVPVSSYVSVSADSGVIQAVRSFDYEQIKDFQFCIKAQDGGSPPLSSNVTVKIMIQDQNDNPPQVLYPVQTGGSLVAEMVPRSADVGYLVTKVVAVDVDSGQNAWLSYKLQKATDRALFEVGLQNGEIRTIRQVTDKDAVKQRLTVIVEDNGQPSRSATVIVNVAVADSFPEVLSEFTDFTHDKEYNDNLSFYLVLALAVVSFLFITCLVVIISVKIYRWRQSRILYHSNLPVIPYYPPRYSDTLGTGTLQHVYNYEVCRTTDSRKSDCKFGRAGSQNVLIMDPSSTGTMQRIQSEKSILDEPDSPLELILENPMELFRVTVEVTDINDNTPTFTNTEKRFEI